MRSEPIVEWIHEHLPCSARLCGASGAPRASGLGKSLTKPTGGLGAGRSAPWHPETRPSTVTAIRAACRRSRAFRFLVPNRAPQPRGTMPAITVPVGRTEAVDASSYFAEPD